jgi:hypothetical protein
MNGSRGGGRASAAEVHHASAAMLATTATQNAPRFIPPSSP